MDKGSILLIGVEPYIDYKLVCYFFGFKPRCVNFENLIKKYDYLNSLLDKSIFKSAYSDLGGTVVFFSNGVEISAETLFRNSEPFDSLKETEMLINQIYSLAKEIRKKSNVTQKELSKLTSIPQSGIARIESGKSDIQLSTLSNYLAPLGYKITITKR